PTRLTKDLLTKWNERKSLVSEFSKPEGVEELPPPIELPTISNVNAEVVFGGWSFIKGKLSWTGSADERVIYRIYKTDGGIGEQLGEVVAQKYFIFNNIFLSQAHAYYFVQYDPLTKLEGKSSEYVKFSM